MIQQLLNSYYENFFVNLLAKAQVGSLKLVTPTKKTYEFKGNKEGPNADLVIHNWSFIKEFLKKGEIGVFKSYQKELFDTSNLANLLSFGVLNQTNMNNVFDLKGLQKLLYSLYFRLRPNSMSGSQKNIHAHYDLSNEFFKLWLDKNFNYSSGLWVDDKTKTLEEAQLEKLSRILKQLDLPAGSHILEIGCGWGAFCEFAAKQGYRVTGITISEEQFHFAKERIRQQQLDELVEIKYIDYRSINEKYDGIVSIEMFEAVGQEYWPTYFKTLKQSLKPGGKAAIQTITINENHFESYTQAPDFIQLYVFPGGMLPSPERFMLQAELQELHIVDSFAFGTGYAQTLKIWLDQFNKHLDEIKNLGFDKEFIQLWRYYLNYCIAGFETKRTNVYQFTLMVK